MVQGRAEEGLFKNIIRQMVRISRSAFSLTENVESLSRNIHEQTHQAGQVREENSSTLGEIKAILQKTSSLTETAELTDQASRRGREKQNLYLLEVEQLTSSIERGRSFLEEFRRSSEDIARLAQLIQDLSGRLDVLAINGAIESARRGEAGLGFNVIAREMKNLAQETAVSAGRVETIVKHFDSSSRDVQELFTTSADSLRESRRDAKEIYDVFLNLEERSSTVFRETSDIRNLMESLASRNANNDRSAARILEASEESGNQISQVDRQSSDLHTVVESVLENMGDIRLDWHEKALKSVKEIAFSLVDQKGRFNLYLQNCFEYFPYIELFYVMDKRGIQVEPNMIHPDFTSQILSGGEGEDRSLRSYYRCVRESGEHYISGLYVSTAVNHLCFTISVPFFRQGEQYILAADINLESFVMQE